MSEQVETGPVDQGTGADVVAGGVDVVVREDVQVVVRDDVAMHRYEGRVGGELAALAVYSRAERFLIFSHTEVLPGYEGRGVASELIRQALDDVRSQGLTVVPLCPFVDAWVRRHLDAYGDLLHRASSRASSELD